MSLDMRFAEILGEVIRVSRILGGLASHTQQRNWRGPPSRLASDFHLVNMFPGRM